MTLSGVALLRQLILPLSLCDISLRPEGVFQRESQESFRYALPPTLGEVASRRDDGEGEPGEVLIKNFPTYAFIKGA